jgi:hypothetical protein
MGNRAIGNKTATFEKKTVGIVEVKVGDTKAKLTFVDGKTFKKGAESLTLPLSAFPKRPKLVSGKQYRVRMNEDEDAVESLGPVSGVHRAKLTGLGKRGKDEIDPKPYVKTFAAGTDKENSHLEFFAQYEIIDGTFKGTRDYAFYLHYKFEHDEDGMVQWDTVDTPQASQLHKLQGWGDAHDVWEEPIEWDTENFDVESTTIEQYSKTHNCEFANILPELERRALETDVEVDLVFEKGYIKSVQKVENYEEAEDSWDESLELEGDAADIANDLKQVGVKVVVDPIVKSKVKKVSKKSKVEEVDDDL